MRLNLWLPVRTGNFQFLHKEIYFILYGNTFQKYHSLLVTFSENTNVAIANLAVTVAILQNGKAVPLHLSWKIAVPLLSFIDGGILHEDL